jgi:hypothetical protein
MTPTYGNSLSRISSMTISMYTPATGYTSPIGITGTCTSSGCPNIRIDNLTIPTDGICTVSDDSFAVLNNLFGVLDHNTVGDVQSSCNGIDFVNAGHGNWLGVGQWGDNSWATADTFGTNQQLYLENNTFNYSFGTDADNYSTSGGGGRVSCRFNTVNGLTPAGLCAVHGTDTGGRLRGGRQIEAYNNTVTCSNSTQGCASVVGGRSGVEIIFGNTITKAW